MHTPSSGAWPPLPLLFRLPSSIMMPRSITASKRTPHLKSDKPRLSLCAFADWGEEERGGEGRGGEGGGWRFFFFFFLPMSTQLIWIASLACSARFCCYSLTCLYLYTRCPLQAMLAAAGWVALYLTELQEKDAQTQARGCHQGHVTGWSIEKSCAS